MTNIVTKTKIDARAESATETSVTIDWSNTSQEDIQALAARTIVIAAQAQWRKDGVIPTEATLDANEYANPTRAPRKPLDPKEAFKRAFEEYKKANPEATVVEFLDTL